MPSLLENFAALSRGAAAPGAGALDVFAPAIDDPSLLAQIGGSALSGLGWLGEVLQKPDRILYAIPSGNPRELLNLIPFSDYFELTDPANMASASTALENFGIIPQNEPGFDLWDIPRFGIDVFGSPSTYFSFGGSAATKAGQVAKGLGLFDDLSRVERMTTPLAKFINPANREAAESIARGIGTTVDAVADQPLGGMFRTSLPFTNIGHTFGQGPVSQAIAGLFDKAGKILPELPYAGGAYRGARMLFDPSAGNRFLPKEQELAGLAYVRKPAEMAAANAARFDATVGFEEAYRAFDDSFGEGVRKSLSLPDDFTPGSAAAEEFAARGTREVFDKLARMAGETGDIGAAWERFVGTASSQPSPELAEQVIGLGRQMGQSNRAVRDELFGMGVDIGLLPELDTFAHQARYVDPLLADDMSKLRPQRLARTSAPSAAARSKPIRTVPAAVVDDLLVDPAARGENAVAHILNRYGRWLGQGDVFEGGIQEHAEALAKWVAEHGEKGLFTRKYIDDFADYQRYGHLAIANTKAVHELVRQTMGASEGVTIAKAYRRAGLNPKRAGTFLANATGKTLKQLKGVKIPQDVADAMVAAIRPWQDREWADLLGKSIGKVNSWFRQNVTLPFLSFAARNFGSGQHVNLAASGLMHTPADIAAYGKAFNQAKNLLRNPEGQRALIREMWANRVPSGHVGHGIGFEGVEAFATGAADSLLPASPLGLGKTIAEARVDVAAKPSLLDKVPGGKAARVAYRTVMGTGTKLNQNVEFLNQAPMYLYLRNKGWTAGAAAKKVHELQFDYGDLTQFERIIRNTAIPFYSFSRKVGPLILRNLIERPGGGVAQTIRATNYARGDRTRDASTPDYISATTAIPLPSPGEGVKRFLTGLGLAHEAPAQYFGGGVRGAGLELLSQLSPVFKAPLEFTTGQSFFQRGPGGGGRPLEELDPTIRRTIANVGEMFGAERQRELGEPGAIEFLLSNSPISRYLTTARQLTDPRKSLLDKALLTTTGLRFSDVSPAAQDAVLRERAGEMMKRLGAKTFEKIYFPKDELAAMPEEQRDAAERLTALQTLMARRSKARKEARETAGSR